MGSKVRTITACLVLFVLLVLSVLVEAGKDYYSILDVPRDAPKTQIKKHFKKLSRVYHPDKNPGDSSASEKFMEIAEGKIKSAMS
jgi:DnaJ-related protein SCJ1